MTGRRVRLLPSLTPRSSRLPAVSCLPRPVCGQHQTKLATMWFGVGNADSPVFVHEDDSVCLQSESPREARPQSLHGLPPRDRELHRAAGCGDDGQTHAGLTGGDRSPAGCRPTREAATEPRRRVHSRDEVRLWALRFLSLAAWLQRTAGA